MTEIVLSTSMGSPIVDGVARGLVGIFETAFPGRLHSYYVDGSYVDGTVVTTSDVDLTIVFRECFRDAAEQHRAEDLAGYCAALSGIELDIAITDDATLAHGVYPSLKMSSLCLYGEDRRDHLPLLPLDEWTRQRMHAAVWLLVHVLHRPPVVTTPLGYPDPLGPFYGYDRRTVRTAEGGERHSTRDLVRVTGWIATALVAYQAGVYVARKRDCHRAYRHHIGDAWATLLDTIYQRCRTDWGYLVPDEEADRQALRALCEETLRFENHFLAIYKHYLLAEVLENGAVARDRALWILGQITFQDEDIRHAVLAVGRQYPHTDQEM